jgi:elongator complex protein 3
VPKYVRIPRVLRDIPAKFIVAGLKDSLRDILRDRMAREEITCRCIRCREYGHRARAGWEPGEPHLIRMDYGASGGREVFLSFEDEQETLFGLLRLRIQEGFTPLPGGVEDRNTALIRELHVFGPEVPLRGRGTGVAQHRGLGKALLREAERIARDEFRVSRMLVLSGVGAREYYRTEFNYASQGDYMVRDLRPRV